MKLIDRLRKSPRMRALLQIDDTVHSIALGAAIGMFIALTPTVGVQMYVAVIICFLFRCNRLWAVAMVWISNPLTMIPLYYGFYMLGCLLMGLERIYTFSKFKDVFEHILSQEGFMPMLREFWRQLVEMGKEVTLPMFLGGLVLGVIFSIPTYFVVSRLVQKNRARKASKIENISESSDSASRESSETSS